MNLLSHSAGTDNLTFIRDRCNSSYCNFSYCQLPYEYIFRCSVSNGCELVYLSVLLRLLCPLQARPLRWMKVLCAVTATHGDSRSSYGLLHLKRALKTLV